MVSVFQRRQYVGITKWCHEISKIPGSRKVKHLDFRPLGSVHFVGTTCRCLLALGPSKSECETGRRSGWSLSTPIRVISAASSRPTSIPNRLRIWPGGVMGPFIHWLGSQSESISQPISPTFPAQPSSLKDSQASKQEAKAYAEIALSLGIEATEGSETAPISFMVEESEVQQKFIGRKVLLFVENLEKGRRVLLSYCLTVISQTRLSLFSKGLWCPHEGILQPAWITARRCSLSLAHFMPARWDLRHKGWTRMIYMIQEYTNYIRFIDIAQS